MKKQTRTKTIQLLFASLLLIFFTNSSFSSRFTEAPTIEQNQSYGQSDIHQKRNDAQIENASSDLPETIYEEWRTTPYPSNNVEVAVNPPALLWPSEKYWHKKDVLYKVYLSQDENFPTNSTITGEVQKYCFFNPHQKMQSGKWFWKYDIIENNKVTTSESYSFKVKPDAMFFETPTYKEFQNRISKKHPRVMNQGRDIDEIRKDARKHPLYKDVVRDGYKALQEEIYRGPVFGGDLATDRTRTRIGNREIVKYHVLLQAYVLSGDKSLLDALLKRTDVLLTWPTNDLLGSKVLGALAQGYDVLYDDLTEKVKNAMLAIIADQINTGLKKWPGRIEARQVENHFWQMEVAGNFIAALATIHDLEESAEMLEYMYEIFIARFPNLSTKEDGGWAEGMGYFEVNKTCMVDMALLMKKVGGVDVFKMNWYKNLPDYYNYFAPVGGEVAGFGDMHDCRITEKMGQEVMMVLGHENEDAEALFRLKLMLKMDNTKLSKIEPWYQIVNNIRFNPNLIEEPKEYSSDKVFKSVGMAAFHTDLFNSKNDVALYFRSSPFGAKGHMHANQNSFNIARKGERIFYSTGYYTTFADPHSLTSYRHTRAHNAILISGLGQAFGHEGYGWIKRELSGQDISYVCGDATMAYRPTVDQQFLKMNKKNGIEETPEFGFGDAQLKLFERHLIFLRPNVVVVYDVLESEVESDWSLLLHSLKEPKLNKDGILSLKTKNTFAKAQVIGSLNLESSVTDKFFSPQIDMKKKYAETPDQFHITYKTKEKSKSMRFLTIIQLGDSEKEIGKIIEKKEGVYRVGDIKIEAELDSNKNASLYVEHGNAKIYVNRRPTDENYDESESSMLIEKINGEEIIHKSINKIVPF